MENILPDKIEKVLASPKILDFNIKLGKKYKLNPDKIHIIALIQAGIFHKQISLQELPKILQKKLGLDSKTTKNLSEDIYNKLFAPLKDYFGELTTPTKPEKAPEPELEKKPDKNKSIKTDSPQSEGLGGKISPYEKKREIPTAKEPEQIYKIRTMKGDIEEVKKQPIPEKSKTKIAGNIVDLSKQ